MSQKWWLDQAGRVPLLTPAEEIELGTLIQRWVTHPQPVPPGIRRAGQRARERFIKANLRLAAGFVSNRCHRLAKQHSEEDLIQAANEGLIRAVERFDPARGYRFSTYAYWWIRQAVNRYVDLYGRSIQIPGSHSQHLYRLAGIRRRLQRELNRDPTREELATELGVSMAVLEQVLANGRSVASLDEVVGDDELTLGDQVPHWDQTPEDQEEQQERWKQAEQLRQLIGQLGRQDQRLLSLAWGLDGEELKPGEIGQREGLAARAVSVRLAELQAALRTASVQLVLLAVERKKPEPRDRSRRRRERPDQLVLVPVERVKPEPRALRRVGGFPRNWTRLGERLRVAAAGGSW
jgi:RNA polymerase primary sigma factor